MTLPSSWSKAHLGDLSVFEMGQAPPATFCNFEGVGTTFVKAGEFGKTYPIVREWTTKPLKFAFKGDILICVVGATAGKLNLGIDCAIGRSVAAIRPLIPEMQRIIYSQLRLDINRLRGDATGSAQGVISKQMLSDIEINVPPLREQRRIADKLDTTLARVDALNDRLARITTLLKRFRQSVLAAATSGRLTEDWRNKNNNKKKWLILKVGDILIGKPRNGFSPKAVDYATKIKSLTLSATTSGKFQGQYSKYLDENIPDDSYLWLEFNDILIQRANSLEYVGVSAIFDGPAKTYVYPDLMMKARANERCLPKFLYLILSSESSRKYMRENATGTAGNMPKINQQTVINIPCELPELDEQTEIVRRVETLFAFADRLEARLQSAQTAAERLTPALLAKAFRGELVPQDPNDEPATELLRCLREARVSGTTSKPKRGRAAKAQTVSE